MELRLYDSCKTGDLEEVVRILGRKPKPDVNWTNPNTFQWTALHVSCENDHHEIVSLLLRQSEIQVNQVDSFGQTPYWRACANGRSKAAGIMVVHPKVDISLKSHSNASPLWAAVRYGTVEVIKWMMASRKEIPLNHKYGIHGNRPLEEAREKGAKEAQELLKRFDENPFLTRFQCMLDIQFYQGLCSFLFVLVVLISDDYFIVQPEMSTTSYGRFFKIACSLPLELQMVISNRAYNQCKNLIHSNDVELSLSFIFREMKTKRRNAH